MTCYAVPAAAAVVHYVFRKKIPAMNTEKQKLLTFLLAGGAIFGIVDHLWNRELFMIGPNLAGDLLLGLTITLVTLIAWMVTSIPELNPLRTKAKS